MPQYSAKSKENLRQCHADLQRLFNEVIKHYDCTITCGSRGEQDQNNAFEKGWSKLRYPNSKHNTMPSLAADVTPYPIDYGNVKRMYNFGGFVKGVASQMGIKIRWGGDWDSDTDLDDQNFIDLPHFELISS
jgi:peptidoglycan L-alanyl-D-glutamate endopeptidase CwlK